MRLGAELQGGPDGPRTTLAQGPYPLVLKEIGRLFAFLAHTCDQRFAMFPFRLQPKKKCTTTASPRGNPQEPLHQSTTESNSGGRPAASEQKPLHRCHSMQVCLVDSSLSVSPSGRALSGRLIQIGGGECLKLWMIISDVLTWTIDSLRHCQFGLSLDK